MKNILLFLSQKELAYIKERVIADICRAEDKESAVKLAAKIIFEEERSEADSSNSEEEEE